MDRVQCLTSGSPSASGSDGAVLLLQNLVASVLAKGPHKDWDVAEDHTG